MLSRTPTRLLFLLLLVTYAYFSGLRNASATSRMAHIVSVAAHGTNTIDRYVGTTPDWSFHDGHYYSNKAPGMSLLCVPICFPLIKLDRLLGRNPLDPHTELWWSNQAIMNVLVNGSLTALGAIALLAILLHLGSSPFYAYAVAAAYGLATPVLPFTTTLHAHGLAASFLIFALYFVLVDKRRPELAGLFCGMATLTEYVAILPTVLLVLYVAAERRSWRDVARFVSGGLPILVIYAAYHWACFGNPLTTAYAHQDPSGLRPGGSHGLTGFLAMPTPSRLAQLLLGPRRGLFFYAPVLLIGVPGLVALARRGHRRLALLCAAIPLAFIAVNCCWFMWDGGTLLGPRFLIPAIPFLAVGAAEFAPRWPKTSLALAAISFVHALAMAAVQVVLDTPDSPMTGYVLPHFARGEFHHDNFGMRLGLAGLPSLLPLFALWAVIVYGIARELRRSETPEAGPPPPLTVSAP